MKNLGKIITFSAILLVFSIIIILFFNQAISFDVSLLHFINGLSNPLLDAIFIPLTYLGSTLFWIILMVMFWIRGHKKLSVYLLYSIIINTILSLSLKWTFLRPRPSESNEKNILFIEDSGPSFPSGHAENVFSGNVILSSFVNDWRFKAALYAISILTAISRIYLGVHYPLDTLFGSLIGIIIGNLVLNVPTEKTEVKIDKAIKRIRKSLKL
jgi:membrane-associated phospholipid phosphatase